MGCAKKNNYQLCKFGVLCLGFTCFTFSNMASGHFWWVVVFFGAVVGGFLSNGFSRNSCLCPYKTLSTYF